MRTHLLATTVVAAAALLAATSARAQTNWTDATGSWFVPGNWSAGVPTAATPLTTVGNGGTAQIAAAPANAGSSLVVNGGSTGDLQAGGSLTANRLTIGPGGTLLLSGSTDVNAFIQLSGGTLRSTTSGTLTNGFNIAGNTISTAAGQTLTFGAGPNDLNVFLVVNNT